MAKKAAKNLVIVESPAKAKTIGKYLGPDYEVMASMGHLRDLPKSKIGVDVDKDFELDYKPIKGKEEIIRELKKAADKADMVYLATDPDREGEAISWHLKYLLDLDDAKTRRPVCLRLPAMAEYGNLPLKSLNSTVNIRFVQCTATVANQIAGGEIIASVNDNIIFCNQPRRMGRAAV